MSFSPGFIRRVRAKSELYAYDGMCDYFARAGRAGMVLRETNPDPWMQWVADLGTREGLHVRAAGCCDDPGCPFAAGAA